MAAWLGGATSSCLCSPLGRSACTNKPTPGLWSNGNQTCLRTKSPIFPFPFLLSSLPPLPCMTNAPLTRTPAEGRTSIILNRPEKILLPIIKFSHTAILHDIPCLCISGDLLDPQGTRFQWPALISTDTLSLTFAYFLYHSFPFALSACLVRMCTQRFPCICVHKCQSFRQSVSTFLHPSKCITKCPPNGKSMKLETPRWCAGWCMKNVIPDNKVWMFSLWGFRVYQCMSSQCLCCLYLNVLFDQSMKIGTESEKKKRTLKTHRASTLTTRLIHRGMTVMRPGDSRPHRHVVLFKLHHFIAVFSFLDDKSGIKIQVNTFFSFFPPFLCLEVHIRTNTDAVFKARKICN